MNIQRAEDAEVAFNTYDPGVASGGSWGSSAIDVNTTIGANTVGVHIHDEVIQDS